jgi:hypothetical protein
MSVPFIVISKWHVKEGKREQLERVYKMISEVVESNEPQIISFQGFLNEDGSELTSIQIHPDSASMDFHMQVLRENWDETFSEYSQVIDHNIRIEYYGTPPASALELDLMSEQVTHLNPVFLAGFTRATNG